MLAAGEQAGARGRAAFGRRSASQPQLPALTNAIVRTASLETRSSPKRSRALSCSATKTIAGKCTRSV